MRPDAPTFRTLKAKFAAASAGITTVMLMPAVAFAAGGGTTMPWDTELQTIEGDLTGPVAKAVGIIAVVLFGLAFAYGEHGSTLRKGLGILFGLAIAFSANTFVATFFGYGGGAGFIVAHAAIAHHVAQSHAATRLSAASHK